MTTPFIFLPFGLQQYSQSLVSMRRIIEYLDSEDLVEYIVQAEPGTLTDSNGNSDVVLQFTNAHISWAVEATVVLPVEGDDKAGSAGKTDDAYKAVPTSGNEEGKPAEDGSSQKENGPNRAINTLVDINLSIREGELVGIVGTVGSGKSSFLNAILGEMHLQSGTLATVKGKKIAFCDQRPWIVNATVQGNITFGSELDEQRLKRAIYVAAMEDDLKILQGGLMCEIGERGINLSGGQKARACLARAVYNDADIYLLDDPLSAVDAHVGEHIFHKCIKEELKNKTVLLVTHHLHVLPQCDKIVILNDDGSILIAGTYDEIMNSGVDVEKYLASKKEEEVVAEPVAGNHEIQIALGR
jgi:ABC-type multidrug transport system fused ATPase/permease subunit